MQFITWTCRLLTVKASLVCGIAHVHWIDAVAVVAQLRVRGARPLQGEEPVMDAMVELLESRMIVFLHF